jgi:hypothetical protein
VFAEQSYTIPLEGAAWDHYTITVQIPMTPKWNQDDVLQGMTIWNEAEQWFKTTYQGRTFRFLEASSRADISISFVQYLPGMGGQTH